MHNKSFTADGQVSIVGGRNIGDEYFGANEEMNFADMDVAVIGPVVKRGVGRIRSLLESSVLDSDRQSFAPKHDA